MIFRDRGFPTPTSSLERIRLKDCDFKNFHLRIKQNLKFKVYMVFVAKKTQKSFFGQEIIIWGFYEKEDLPDFSSSML